MNALLVLPLILGMAGASIACAPGAGTASPAPIRDGAASAALGGHARFGGLDVVPLRVEEDSRCPARVQCIQAGTVRLTVRIDARGARSERVLTLDRSIELAGGVLTLKNACPYPAHPGAIPKASYLFTFTFSLPGRAPPLVPDCIG
jgi:hypothetical protein